MFDLFGIRKRRAEVERKKSEAYFAENSRRRTETYDDFNRRMISSYSDERSVNFSPSPGVSVFEDSGGSFGGAGASSSYSDSSACSSSSSSSSDSGGSGGGD